MIELFWLLLPVAATSGWLVAKGYYRRHMTPISSKSMDAQYFQGLNYLLNEQSDKALDLFVNLSDINQDTLDLHLALGSLFRRKGEVDRAIAIHQNLLSRQNLPLTLKDQCLLELAQDYLKAGLLDRAERIFIDLRQSSSLSAPALFGLLEVYQREKEWLRAINTAQAYEKLSGDSQVTNIAHYYCELANQAMILGEKNEVLKQLKMALLTDPGCARANLIQSQLEIKQGNYKIATQLLLNIIDQDPAFLGEVIDPLIVCVENQGKISGLVNKLSGLVNKYSSNKSVTLFSQFLQKYQGTENAIALIESHLEESPSALGLKRYLELSIVNVKPEQKNYMEKLLIIVNGLIQQTMAYRCEQCGFSARAIHWQCPSCNAWGSVKPL